jgi:hypothetical protein
MNILFHPPPPTPHQQQQKYASSLSTQGFVYAPWGLPSNHPGLDRFFESEEVPYGEFPIVYFDHPSIHEAYRMGTPMPRGHPSAMGLVRV